MASYYDTYSVYSGLRKSAECAFGISWEALPLSEELPANFRQCVEEALASMRRAKRIADLVIANNIVAEKQKELKEAENNLKNLESNELSGIRKELNRIADAIETKNALGVSFKVETSFDHSDGPFESQEPEEPEGFADME